MRPEFLVDAIVRSFVEKMKVLTCNQPYLTRRCYRRCHNVLQFSVPECADGCTILVGLCLFFSCSCCFPCPRFLRLFSPNLPVQSPACAPALIKQKFSRFTLIRNRTRLTSCYFS